MPIIPYTPQSFPVGMGPRLQTAATVECQWSDILRAAITVGRRNARAVFQHGMHSVFEANYRAYMVKANLTEDRDTQLVRTQAYRDLDRSEKGAVSYFLSMGLIKLLCEHFFSVPWLVHLDNFDGLLDPPLARGSRPDLIGKDANDDWIVVEVKGRSNNLPAALLTEGKAQCRMIRLIEGQQPSLRLVGGLYFDSHRVQTILRDPKETDRRAADLKIDRAKLLREYYGPIAEAVAQGEEQRSEVIGDRTYIVARFPSLDFELGLEDQIQGAVSELGDERFLAQVTSRIRSAPSTIANPQSNQIKSADKPSVQILRTRSTMVEDIPRSVSIGYDGTFVRVGDSWSAGSLLAPAER